MKIRNGFVSNSSSSSFILRKDANTIEITVEELIERLNKGGNPEDFMIISDSYEGFNAFELTSNMGYLIRSYPDRFLENGKSLIDLILYKVAAFYSDTRAWSDEHYGKNEGLDEGESCIWVNYNSIGSAYCYDDDMQFFKRFFLSNDEYDFVESEIDDAQLAFCTKRNSHMSIYSDRKELSECDDNYIHSCDSIGFNEDFTGLDTNSMFVYKKLTKEDKQSIISNKQNFKKGVCLYKDFEVLKDSKFKALESRVYYVINLRGLIEKSKKLDVFIAEEQ